MTNRTFNRYIAYARSGAPKPVIASASVAGQIARLASFIEERGGVVVANYEVTAACEEHEKSQALHEAVCMIERGEADVLACVDMSRLGRDMEVAQRVKERVELAGGEIVCRNPNSLEIP